MPTFNAADIIGKTLIAKKQTNILRLPTSNAISVYQANAGETIGVVNSYLLPNNQRNNIFWMFEDSNGKPYYVEHKQNQFDVKTLQQQGVLTLEEIKAQTDAANETIGNKIFRYIKNGFLIAASAYVLKAIIDSQQKK